MKDAAKKGRLHVSRPRRQKITIAQLAEIDRLLAAGLKQREVAGLFGVTEGWMSSYANGRRRQYGRSGATTDAIECVGVIAESPDQSDLRKDSRV